MDRREGRLGNSDRGKKLSLGIKKTLTIFDGTLKSWKTDRFPNELYKIFACMPKVTFKAIKYKPILETYVKFHHVSTRLINRSGGGRKRLPVWHLYVLD